MKKKFILILCATAINCNTRDIIVLLDQEGICENIGRSTRWSIMHRFQSALEEQVAPILVNTALLQTFFERRHSIDQMSKIPDTPEQKAVSLYNKIKERLTYWYTHLTQEGVDPIQAKQLMLDKVNKEFYAASDVKAVPDGINGTLRAHLTHFEACDWQVYTNQKGMYLLVPNKYVKRIDKEDKPTGKSRTVTAKELHLGLKVDHLTAVDDVENPVLLYLKNHANTQRLPHHLHDFFVTHEDFPDKKMPYEWNVVLSGHGWFSYNELIRSKKAPDTSIIIADLTPHEMRGLLKFLNNRIQTHYFHISTCTGGGEHWNPILEENADYNFTIGTDSLSDGTSYCLFKILPFPDGANRLQPDEVDGDSEGAWHLKLDHVYQWGKFFENMSAHSFKQPGFNSLCQTISYITSYRICNTTQIRLPHASSFIPVIKGNMHIINDTFLKYSGTDQARITVADSTLFLQTKKIELPLICTQKDEAPRIVSILPGVSVHYIHELEFESGKNIQQAFLPVEGNIFDKFFIIREFKFPNTEKQFFTDQFGITDESVTLKNVLVHVQNADVVRIFFQTSKDTVGMIIVTHENEKPEFKGIKVLNQEATNLYLAYYTKLKEEIIKN